MIIKNLGINLGIKSNKVPKVCTRFGIMLYVMIMHCTALHVFKVMLVMYNAKNLFLQVMLM